MKDGILAANEKSEPVRRLMPILEFAAWNDEGRPVRVIGVADDDEDVMSFVVIIEDVDGDEIYPIIERSVFKRNPLVPGGG